MVENTVLWFPDNWIFGLRQIAFIPRTNPTDCFNTQDLPYQVGYTGNECISVIVTKLLFVVSGRFLYWCDWNREAPKIETSHMDGTNRRLLAKDNLSLPNGLTYDPQTSLLCWADAGELPSLSQPCVCLSLSVILSLTHSLSLSLLHKGISWGRVNWSVKSHLLSLLRKTNKNPS